MTGEEKGAKGGEAQMLCEQVQSLPQCTIGVGLTTKTVGNGVVGNRCSRSESSEGYDGARCRYLEAIASKRMRGCLYGSGEDFEN